MSGVFTRYFTRPQPIPRAGLVDTRPPLSLDLDDRTQTARINGAAVATPKGFAAR